MLSSTVDHTAGARRLRGNQERHEAQLDRLFHALSDRTRRAMVGRLAQGPVGISELAAPFEMSLPGASKHVRVLEQAGLVARHIDGRVHRCELRLAPLHDAQDWIAHQRVFWERTLDALQDYAVAHHGVGASSTRKPKPLRRSPQR